MPPTSALFEATSRRAIGTAVAAAVALGTGLSGCSGPAAAESRGVLLTVSAAASLGTAFTDLAAEFERTHPRVDVALNVGGSSELAAQIVEGAPADVFAAASDATMTTVVDAGLAASEPRTFARNTLAIAVAPGNPHGVDGLADLSDHSPDDRSLTVVACAPAVPCGAVATTAASAAGISLALASEELSVTDVLAKVISGEADAGLVYRTDIAAAGDVVDGVWLPQSDATTTAYPIVALTAEADDPASRAAAQWIDFVTGPTGQATLHRLEFGAP
ncbi:molybdate ABC transporter substrate-binding protein [Mycetocola sp. 2940]|uniref:molybdate ABC transporter substrate-binding protein n=1 Tax=Mycetocola sp. 2940 TaxID=3156452 RepID=UPI00339708BE